MRRYGRRHGEAEERTAERRRREDSAPRLVERVPNVESLRLELRERRAGVVLPESAHVRPIPVAYAPALFDLPCLDSACKDGGHDLTETFIQALQSGKASFTGEHAWHGQTGTAECQRILEYTATATYKR
ncbi:MAG TPA: hypothetical protein VIM73_03935 [Polyangiaceae bacterium]